MSKKRTKNTPLPTHFGKNLRFLRRLNGLSQQQLATHLAMSRGKIASYESGLVEPKADQYLKTCAYFDVNPVVMLERDLSDQIPAKSDRISEQHAVSAILLEQMAEYTQLTNEFTKVLEGYKAIRRLQTQSYDDPVNPVLTSIQENLIELFTLLIKSNWTVIQNTISLKK